MRLTSMKHLLERRLLVSDAWREVDEGEFYNHSFSAKKSLELVQKIIFGI